jgi:hypothetical protein
VHDRILHNIQTHKFSDSQDCHLRAGHSWPSHAITCHARKALEEEAGHGVKIKGGDTSEPGAYRWVAKEHAVQAAGGQVVPQVAAVHIDAALLHSAARARDTARARVSSLFGRSLMQ